MQRKLSIIILATVICFVLCWSYTLGHTNSVNFAEEKDGAESLDDFMKDVAEYLDKPYSTISKFTDLLKDNWFTTVDSLRSIDDKAWDRLGFPLGLVDGIKTLLGDCSSNTECNDRGTCKTDPKGHRGQCLCESGFTGNHCEDKQKCNLPCQHGGTPNSDCSACENCLGAWTGTFCDTYDYKVPLDKLKPQLLKMASDSEQHQKDLQKVRPLPAHIGVGVDITTGQLRLPVVSLSYSDTSKTWTNAKGETFRIPVESSFQVIPTGIYNPKTESFVFTSMSDYVDQQFSWSTSLREGSTGMFANNPDLEAIYTKYFSGDELLTVSQQFYPLYKLTLPTDDKGNPTYTLDTHAQRALDFLPPDASTDTNKQLYQLFVENWGTSFSTTAINGGIVELKAIYDSLLLSQNLSPSGRPYTKDDLEDEANRDFICITKTGSCHTPDKTYTDHRKLDAVTCYGGDPAACTSKNFTRWAESIQYDTSILMYSLSDNGALIKDSKKRANIQQTIQQYVGEQEKKAKHQNTCPKCSEHGTCTPPQDHCTCDGPHFTGRTCSQCIEGWSGADCNTPVCSGGCGHGKCTAPGHCECSGHFTGAQCDQCQSGWSGSNCDKPVCPGGCKHGSCVAPNQCKCTGRYAGQNCDQCIEGWHGSNCDQGQSCFKCYGSGQVCSSLGCEFGKVSCPACSGTGQVPDNVQKCFRCYGTGEVCSDSGCTFGHVTCPGCTGKGYVPGNVHRCSKCNGQGKVCSSSGCTFGMVTCPSCHGHGYVE